MGYMRHHAILVTTFRREYADKAHAEAIRLGMDVSPINTAAVNGFESFVIFPDGSKEGWGDSDDGDARRTEFKRWLRSQDYEDGSNSYDWAEVQYGDDEGESIITDHKDAERREADAEAAP